MPPAVYDDIGIVHSGNIPLKQNAAYGPSDSSMLKCNTADN